MVSIGEIEKLVVQGIPLYIIRGRLVILDSDLATVFQKSIGDFVQKWKRMNDRNHFLFSKLSFHLTTNEHNRLVELFEYTPIKRRSPTDTIAFGHEAAVGVAIAMENPKKTGEHTRLSDEEWRDIIKNFQSGVAEVGDLLSFVFRKAGRDILVKSITGKRKPDR